MSMVSFMVLVVVHGCRCSVSVCLMGRLCERCRRHVFLSHPKSRLVRACLPFSFVVDPWLPRGRGAVIFYFVCLLHQFGGVCLCIFMNDGLLCFRCVCRLLFRATPSRFFVCCLCLLLSRSRFRSLFFLFVGLLFQFVCLSIRFVYSGTWFVVSIAQNASFEAIVESRVAGDAWAMRGRCRAMVS